MNVMATINPYLTFDGDCEEAFTFYKGILGGEFEFFGRFSDMPDKSNIPDAFADKVMHVSLPVGNGTILMGSDSLPGMGKPIQKGNNFSISVNADTPEEAKQLFDDLSTGGEIEMPFDKTFWNAYFGKFTDKFGVGWMVNCAIK